DVPSSLDGPRPIAAAMATGTRASPHALRARRHRHRDTRRCEKSDGKFLHKNLLVAALMKTSGKPTRVLKLPATFVPRLRAQALKRKSFHFSRSLIMSSGRALTLACVREENH